MNPEQIINDFFEEISKSLKALGKAKTPEERLIHSQVVKNLCDSLGAMMSTASEIMDIDDDDDRF